jgi:hypothetical protein
MPLGLIVGVSLVMAGLVLLCHLSYTELSEKSQSAVDPEDPTQVSRDKGHENDCLLPMCFFQTSRVRNHESWIVAFLLSGAAVLLMSLT